MFKQNLFIILCIFIGASCKNNNAKLEEANFTQSRPHINPTRYEIIQSPLAAKWTFRLDRYKGNVCQLVETRSGNLGWEEMRITGLEAISENDQKIRFQIYTSGLAAKHTYLIDLESGKTWCITSQTTKSGEEVDIYWEQFER